MRLSLLTFCCWLSLTTATRAQIPPPAATNQPAATNRTLFNRPPSTLTVRTTNAPAPATVTTTPVVSNALTRPPAPAVSITNAPPSANPAVASSAGTNAPAGTPAFPAFPVLPSAPGATPPPQAASALTNAVPPFAAGTARTVNSTNATENAEALIEPGAIKFQAMPLEQFLDIYADLVYRTILRPAGLPDAKITINTKTPLTRQELIRAFDSVLAMNQVTMIPVGEKFIKAVPETSAMREASSISKINPKELPEAGQFVTQIIQVTNVMPTEIAPTLQLFAKTQGGILAIDSSQTLVLRDYAENIKRMMEIIVKVDVAPPEDYRLEVVPIKYGKVDDIYQVMSGLIGGGGGGGGAAAPRTGAASSRTTSRSRGSSTSSNRNLRTPGQQPGQPGQPGQPIQPAAANPQQASYRDRLAQILGRAASGGTSEILGDARIIPDDRANSLVVYANKQDMVMITNIVAKLDVLLAQVLIEAAIMDVRLGDELSYGVSSAAGPRTTGKLTSVAGSMNGPSFLSGVTNFPTGLPSGFSYFGKYGGDLDVAVTAIANSSTSTVLQRPRIQTTHAVAAEFFNGETVPYITSQYYGGGYGGSPSSSYSQLEVGIRLSVTPYITPDNLVVMEINQEINEVSGFTKIGNDDVPNTTERTASATISVRDGETVMLGGFIKSSKSKTKGGVPLLKDIPLLGLLFSSTDKKNNRSELLVLMRPTVLSTPGDAARVLAAERERLPGIRQAEKDIAAEELQQSKKVK